MTGPDHHAEMEAHFAAGMERQEASWGKPLTEQIREILGDFDQTPQDRYLREHILDFVIEDMHRHLTPNDVLIEKAFEDVVFGKRRGPPGILSGEIHTQTCKAAERVTRQQRRQAERAAAKNRIGGRKR